MAETDEILLGRARRMRRQPTVANAALGCVLRGRQIANVKFARQVVIGRFIADFAARAAKLVMEVDGDTHTDQARDERRTAWFQQRGYRLVRFSNTDVMNTMDRVWHAITAALVVVPHPAPGPAGKQDQKDPPQ